MPPKRTLFSMSVFLCLISGALFGFSLIVAIGPQNSFVLRRGLAGHHVLAVVMVCILSDVTLIALGTAGVGSAIHAQRNLMEVVRFAGAAFLLTYAAFAIRRAVNAQTTSLLTVGNTGSLRSSISTCLAFTWLNPHVYFDTVVLLGAVASARGGNAIWFALGAMFASTVWFIALGFGARFLRPLFVKPNATRLLDAAIAVIMLSIGLSLVTQGLTAG